MASDDRKVLIVIKALMMGFTVEMSGYKWRIVNDRLCVLSGIHAVDTNETLTMLIARASKLSSEEVMAIAERIGKGEPKSFVQQLLDAGKITMLDDPFS